MVTSDHTAGVLLVVGSVVFGSTRPSTSPGVHPTRPPGTSAHVHRAPGHLAHRAAAVRAGARSIGSGRKRLSAAVIGQDDRRPSERSLDAKASHDDLFWGCPAGGSQSRIRRSAPFPGSE